MIPTITIQSEIKRLIKLGEMALDRNGLPYVVLKPNKPQPNGMYNLIEVLNKQP